MSVLFLVLILLICNKLYKSIMKRMFLCLVVVTSTKEALHFVSIEHQWQYSGQDIYCIWHGYLQNVTLIAVLLISLLMILYLLYQVYILVYSNPFPRISQSKCRIVTLEIFYITIPIFVSFAYSLGPLIRGSNGLADTWCWIQSVNENCSYVGLLDQLVFGHGVYEVIGVVTILLTIINIVVYYKLSITFQDARVLLKKTLLLTGCLLVRILFGTFVFAARVLRATEATKINTYPLSITQAMATPLSDLIFPFGFLLFFYSIKNLFIRPASSFAQCCASLCCCKRNKQRNAYQDLNKTLEARTTPPSTRQSQPSESFYRVSYTGDFTAIASHSAYLPNRNRLELLNLITNTLPQGW